MPEPPDFDQLAQDLLYSGHPELLKASEIAEQLRQVWNARGAMDVAVLDAYGDTRHLAAHLRTLDR
jgi:hypothetical protein